MSWFLVIWLLFVFGFGCFTYRVYRRRIHRWWQAMIVKRGLPPHERWPEILHWQKGDEFDAYPYHMRTLVSIDSDGYAVIDWLGKRSYAHLSGLVGHNASARTRAINERLKESSEYMEMIRQFNIAYKELQERDKKNGIAA